MEFLRLFPTNIAISRVENFEEINQKLVKNSFMYDGSHRMAKRINFWDRRHDHPEIQELYDLKKAAVVEYANNYHSDQTYRPENFLFPDGWINEQEPDEGLYMHNHKINHLVCIYYWHVPEGSGPLDFVDPRATLGFISLDKSTPFNVFRMQPKTGDLLIFPGWLLHYVWPNTTGTPRKVIGANVKINEDDRVSPPGLIARTPGDSIMRLG
jgi:uncharacterized protein (TIGR02466 family)